MNTLLITQVTDPPTKGHPDGGISARYDILLLLVAASAAASAFPSSCSSAIWREFRAAAHLDDDPVDMLALFEKHDVVDTLSFHEACEVGLAFDHEEAIAPILCSHGRRYRLETFDRTQPWAPMVGECDGRMR